VRVAVVWRVPSGDKPLAVAEDLPVHPGFPLRFQLELHKAPPPEAMQTLEFQSYAFRGAYGVVVAYEDVNHNGRLDIVGNELPEFVDRLLGGGLTEAFST